MKKPIRHFLIIVLSAVTIFTACTTQEPVVPEATSGQEQVEQEIDTDVYPVAAWEPAEDTERTQRALETYETLFADMEMEINATNPDYADIINNFIYGDVYHQSDLLDTRERQLITLVSLTTFQSYELLKQHAVGAVNVGVTPEEVMEAVYHTTPYVGIATSYEAVKAVTEAFIDNGIELPLPSRTTVSDSERFAEGNQAQIDIFGPFMERSEEDMEDGINKYVTDWCFGDFYTRDALDLELRELLTMCILANMNVDQFSAHVRGTNNVGYSEEEIVAAITQSMPYMGTPRALTALSVVNEVFAPAEESGADDTSEESAESDGQEEDAEEAEEAEATEATE